MITVLPDHSFQLPNVADDVLPPMVAPSTKEIEIKQRRFSAFNIIIALIVLSLVAGIIYFYLPDSKVDKKSIIQVHKSLLDISQQKKGEQVKNGGGRPIMNPNDGSSKSSSSKTSTSSNTNDKSTKHTNPIPKDKDTIIGSSSGAPGDGDDDDDEDEDKEKKDRDNKKKDGLLNSNQQQQSSQQSEINSEELDTVNDLQENWINRPVSDQIPLLGNQRN